MAQNSHKIKVATNRSCYHDAQMLWLFVASYYASYHGVFVGSLLVQLKKKKPSTLLIKFPKWGFRRVAIEEAKLT